MSYTLNKTGSATAQRNRQGGTTWTVPYKLFFADGQECDQEGVMAAAYRIFRQQIILQEPIYKGYYWDSFNVSGDTENPGVFNCSAVYSPKGNEREDRKKPTVTISTSAHSEHITHGNDLTTVYTRDGAPEINYHGAINVSTDGVEGCDILAPTWTHTISLDLPASAVTTTFLNDIYSKTGRVNKDPIWFFGKHELLFTGMIANSYWQENPLTEDLEQWYSLTFTFQGMPSVRMGISGFGTVEKKGWDYFWVSSDVTEISLNNDGVKIPLKIPRQINVEEVYPETSFEIFNSLSKRT